MSREILDCLKRKQDICIKKHNTQAKYGFHVYPRLKLNPKLSPYRTLLAMDRKYDLPTKAGVLECLPVGHQNKQRHRG